MGRLKNLEAENIELKKQVEFFKSWLDGEVNQTDTKELKNLRRELTAARGAASALETELDALRQRLEATLGDLRRQSERADSSQAEADAEKKRADDLGRQLAELTEEHARLARRADKGARRWYFMCDPKSKRPKPGEYVLVCAFAMFDTMEQIAGRSSRLVSEFLIRDSFYREDKNGNYDFAGLPTGYIAMAWQPIVEPDWSEIQKDAMAGLKAWSENTEGRARELEQARKRVGARAAERFREIHDKVRAALEKGAYRPARDRVGKDLVFMRGRAAGERKADGMKWASEKTM